MVLTLEAAHELVALDTDTGDVAWSAPIVEGRQAWIGGSDRGVEVGAGRLAVREPTRLAVLDPADGEVVFEVAVPAAGTMPVFVGPLVVVAGEGQLHAWDGETGEAAWQTALDVDPVVPLISAEGSSWRPRQRKRSLRSTRLERCDGERAFPGRFAGSR